MWSPKYTHEKPQFPMWHLYSISDWPQQYFVCRPRLDWHKSLSHSSFNFRRALSVCMHATQRTLHGGTTRECTGKKYNERKVTEEEAEKAKTRVLAINYSTPFHRPSLPPSQSIRGVGCQNSKAGNACSARSTIIKLLSLARSIQGFDTTAMWRRFGLVWFGLNTGSCKKERVNVQFTVHQTISIADSLTDSLTPSKDFSTC